MTCMAFGNSRLELCRCRMEDYYEYGKYPNFDRLCELMRERRRSLEPKSEEAVNTVEEIDIGTG